MNKQLKWIVILGAVLLSVQARSESLAKLPLNPEDFTTPPAASMPGILWFWHQTPMTPEVIREQMTQMHAAGFRGIMMFPLGSTPKFYTEEFYALFELVLRKADELGMSIWLTNDQHIPTGHGATMVVPGGKIHDGLTLEPRPDLRALKLLHVQEPVTGGKMIDLRKAFPGIHSLPSVINHHGGEMTARSTGVVIGNSGANWMDYKYTLDLTPKNWAGNPLVPGSYINTEWIFRGDKKTLSGYSWSLTDHSDLGKGVPALKKSILKDGKAIKSLPTVRLPFALEEKPYHIETRILGNRFETFIDGKSVDVTIDDTFTKGTIGFNLPHPCRGHYDNFRVLSHGDDVLFEDLCENNAQWRFWAPSAAIEEVFSVAAVPLKGGKLQGEGILDLSAQFKSGSPWQAPEGEWALDYFMKRHDTKMPFNYPDLFNPDTIKRHLQITYGEIVRRYPWAIGTTFKGFWSDEPHSVAGDGFLVWSDAFTNKIATSGKELAPVLSAVVSDLGREGRQLRSHYFQQVVEGWADPFARLQGEWCKSKGLDFMTNPVCDSVSPYGAFGTGDALQMNQWSSAPGVDAIYGQILPDKKTLISRWATSSANQMGNQHVLYEVFGGYGWDVTPDIVRYVNGYLMVRGCNRASYHAYWTNPDAVGYAPPFDPSNPWWFAQKDINLWNGRLQEANLGKAVSEVALLNPVSTLYADEMNLDGRLMNPAFDETYYQLEDTQVSFDLLDETSLNGNPIMTCKAKPVDGGIQVGEQLYRLVILPRAHTISLEALKTLEQMVRNGGVVIATHLMPEEELNGRDPELQTLLLSLFGSAPGAQSHAHGAGWTAFAKSTAELIPLLDQAKARTITLAKENSKIRVLKRLRKNTTLYILMNEGEETADLTASFKDTRLPELWDPENGSRRIAPVFTSGQSGTVLPLKLTPHQLKVVVFRDDSPSVANTPHLVESPLEVSAVEASADGALIARVVSGQTGTFALKGTFKNEAFKADVSLPPLPSPLRLDAGWQLSFADQPGKNQPAQPGSWTDLRANYSGTATYTQTLEITADSLDSNRRWILDLGTVHDVARIEINGHKSAAILWPPYEQDITPHLKSGSNTIRVHVTNTLANQHGESKPSGILGPVVLKPVHAVAVELKNGAK